VQLRSAARAALLLAALLGLTATLPAQTVGTGNDRTDEYGVPTTGGQEKPGLQAIALRLGLYQKDDPGPAGNPFLDESLTVIEPIMIVDWGLDERSALSFTFSYDRVSSASIERLNEYPGSQQSGASGDNYFGLSTAYRYHWDERTRVGGHIDVSTEYDYTSLGAGADIAWASRDGNLNQSLALTGYFDTVEVIRYDGSNEGNETRDSLAATYRGDRILDPRSHLQWGSTLSLQNGFLSTAYNGVFIEDPGGVNPPVEVAEVLPDSRVRLSVFGSYRRWIREGGAAEFATRFYNDDWGITGISLEPRWYQRIGDDLLLRFRYRFYDQSGSDYSGRFTAEQEYMTQDSDLAEFSSHTVGMRVIGYRKGQQGWDAGVDYVMRSDDLDHLMASFGYTWTF